MRQPSRRPEQVAGTIRQVIAEALTREIRDPRVGFVTVTGVLVTNDLSHARVSVSVPGEEAEKTRALQGLQSAAGFLRSRVARALTTRTVPELHFELDKGVGHAARIEAVEGLGADVVTARAYAPLDRLLEGAVRFWTPDTSGLFLKGQDIDAELTTAAKCWKFKAERLPSRSDPSGVVLRVGGLARADADH